MDQVIAIQKISDAPQAPARARAAHSLRVILCSLWLT
jgi:hypothetical protein